MPDETPSPRTTIVVLTQHGDNRGDEAAMRAMVRGVGERLPGAEFVIVQQFADADSEVELSHPASYLPMGLPVWEYARLALFALLLFFRLRVPAIAGQRGRAIIDALARADLAISAPGGPYFGDLYADHEIAHWLLVFVAKGLGKPLILYAPSCGPFDHRWLRPVRRFGFRCFDAVCLREPISAAMLEQFVGIRAVVTTDAAFQDVVPPADRHPWLDGADQLLVVAVRDPGGELTTSYDRAVLDAIHAAVERAPTTVVFLPQLHGATHRDAPYLQSVAGRVAGAHRVVVADESIDSNGHRALVAAADFVIAGRYHPAVFAISAGTPVLVIAYEHKAMGVAEAAGITEWAMWLDDVPREDLRARMIAVIEAAPAIRQALAEAGPRLRALAAVTAETAAQLSVRRAA
jgi:colanic acid/amylovoran biosynthesis protein